LGEGADNYGSGKGVEGDLKPKIRSSAHWRKECTSKRIPCVTLPASKILVFYRERVRGFSIRFSFGFSWYCKKIEIRLNTNGGAKEKKQEVSGKIK